MKIEQKLAEIQSELKAPKNLRNTFGNYNYRNTETILESVKPLLKVYKCTLTITDTLEVIGDRYYIKATATLFDHGSEQKLSVSAYAREEENKKGMDSSQVTGATSSYARKYALNGLFLIDDTKDADSDEYQKQSPPTSPQVPTTTKPLPYLNKGTKPYDNVKVKLEAGTISMKDVTDNYRLSAEIKKELEALSKKV